MSSSSCDASLELAGRCFGVALREAQQPEHPARPDDPRALALLLSPREQALRGLARLVCTAEPCLDEGQRMEEPALRVRVLRVAGRLDALVDVLLGRRQLARGAFHER